jgi:hypothetical protein
MQSVAKNHTSILFRLAGLSSTISVLILKGTVRFPDYAIKAHGIDFSGPPPPFNENTADWQESDQRTCIIF